ncbi:triose-phosphate isomerase [Helicobacter sp. 13S00477-4]|uniref:triose-phosphate isomerase n=1 Tax=Helicobacter sp. 13S00477-4 TaxID=1905759 RepID=UPI000BA6C10E|nr:triose-phosphate isomerase [Helicobacter sp. 13S00477-4]PAF52419.1 triose-phosphate isomerase [Helicobacter sp. 13S00477-4]
MEKIIVANFKSNLTRVNTVKYLRYLDAKLQNLPSRHIYIFPSMSSLCKDSFKNFQLGTQNAYPVYNGAYTGEIGLEALDEFCIKTIMIGHSERRYIFGETQKLCIEKFDFFSKKQFTIIYCIGESLSIRQQGLESTINFLKTQLKGIDFLYKDLIIAYEPIWAIGTGRSATIEQIKQTHHAIKEICSAPLIYGGSVNEKNAQEILQLPEVDGILVGSASLNAENFYHIIQGK